MMASTLRPAAVARRLAAATTTTKSSPSSVVLSVFSSAISGREFSSSTSNKGGGSSSSSNNNNKSFRPRRRPNPNYRPIKANRKKKKDWMPDNDHKFVTLGEVENPKDELEAQYGPLAAATIRKARKDAAVQEVDPHEEELRAMDYWTAQHGSTEELVFERRAFEHDSEEERARFYEEMEQQLRDGEKYDIDFESDIMRTYKKNPLAEKEKFNRLFEGASGEDYLEPDEDNEDEDPELVFDKNQLAHGEWSEMLIDVRRGTKLWRGGRLESYRALVIGGNCNGCAGFGIGKAPEPMKAVELAGRNTKRNIFFVDRHQGDGLTRDLVGKQNSCKVIIRATDNGLRGNELCAEILMRFGITNAVCKAHGNRHPWNVVRATFKALLTHEGMEDIALKRGKRLVSIERALRMQI